MNLLSPPIAALNTPYLIVLDPFVVCPVETGKIAGGNYMRIFRCGVG